MRRWFIWLLLPVLAACSGAADLNDPPVDLGDFKLYQNFVYSGKAAKGPLSRDATEEQLTDAMTLALEERFGRYDGTGFYHFGVSVEGYVLAAPGVPLVLSPKSVLIVNVTVWESEDGEATPTKLNEEVQTLTVIETFGTGTLLGSGYTLTAEEQLRQLTQNAAKSIERYMVMQKNAEGWFEGGDTTEAETSAVTSG